MGFGNIIPLVEDAFLEDETRHLQNIIQNEPVHEFLVLIANASCEGSDESACLRSLVRTFLTRRHKGRT